MPPISTAEEEAGNALRVDLPISGGRAAHNALEGTAAVCFNETDTQSELILGIGAGVRDTAVSREWQGEVVGGGFAAVTKTR